MSLNGLRLTREEAVDLALNGQVTIGRMERRIQPQFNTGDFSLS
jgi:hypothetical protein